jgi:chromate reductase
MTYKIAVIVGSLRKDSFTRKAAEALAKLTPQLEFDFVPIGDLPHYNQDLDPDSAPPAWVAFRDRVRGADGVLFATPEYNRSVPGVLKNAIDVGSRPYGKSVWDGKPAAVLSVTPGALGAFGANHHLRQSLVFLNMPTMQQPEAYLGNAGKLFDKDSGALTDESTAKFLASVGAAFAGWVAKHAKAKAPA